MPFRTRGLVRRATPFIGIAAVFAVAIATGASSLLAFPLFLIAVLAAALFDDRATLVAVGTAASLAALVLTVAHLGPTSNLATAVFEVAVLAIVGASVHEVVERAREAEGSAEKKADDLESTDGRMRMTLEAATVGLGLVTVGGHWVQANRRLATILGRGRDELLQVGLLEVMAESDRHAVEDALGQLGRREILRWESEVQQASPDGKRFPVALAIAAISDEGSGEPLLLVQETDISARKRLDAMRDALIAVRQIIVTASAWEQAAPALLRSLCTHLDWDLAQYWSVDGERHALSLRNTWHRDGYSDENFNDPARNVSIQAGGGLVGRVWQSGIAAALDDLAANEFDQSSLERRVGLRAAVAFPVISGGATIGVVELLGREARHTESDVVAVLSTAGVEIGQFIQRSETAQALRRSEADHRAIYERSPIGIARVSSEGELLECNPAMLQMLEHDVETMRTQAWPELLRAYDQAAGRARLAPLLTGITDQRGVHVRAATGGGRWLWLQMTATSIPDSTGRPEHLLVMVEDVTTVRETQDRLAEALDSQRGANATLERLDRTKTEFLSIVSHEFRTALTGIQGFSELIRDGGIEPDEVRAYGGYIFNDADRVNRLIGDMLDLDRMESGRMSIRLADVDINEVVSDVMTRAASSPTVIVELKADFDPRLPIVTGDRDRLVQVVSNLVNNAVKYSPDGGLVTLSTRADGAFALISVSDTGLGIPPDEIGHVFERFRRVRSGAAQSIPGTGLGLTIVKQIVEMHGGKIWVESAVGHGSAFHFTIPLAAEHATPPQRRHA
ncbi:MAG TPA: ATP-binding protein [Candidatus Dormibacteraeota bacterium]|nr:ATP-binding protein [Candidatus Dormibacteraeota bacterium]